MQVPVSVKRFFSLFPVYTYPPNNFPVDLPKEPTLWIQPPAGSDTLSADVECLKWQAYLALRGLTNIRISWEFDAQGALEGRLPNICLPNDGQQPQLFPASHIPGWTDEMLGVNSMDIPLEGYVSEAMKDESRAWVSLLEGAIHAALILSAPVLSPLLSVAAFSNVQHPNERLRTMILPPPPPVTGITRFIPPFAPFGAKIPYEAVMARYTEAIGALSERLGRDKWFLGSTSPTPLDALVFAYIHCALNGNVTVKSPVTSRVNLVAWETRVRGIVRGAFTKT